jgi:hypothetical protein
VPAHRDHRDYGIDAGHDDDELDPTAHEHHGNDHDRDDHDEHQIDPGPFPNRRWGRQPGRRQARRR